jgi:chemotaxis response regulator CheB
MCPNVQGDVAELSEALLEANSLGPHGHNAVFLLVGAMASLAAEPTGHHALLMVTTGGVQALQAVLQSLPKQEEWSQLQLTVAIGKK